MKAAIYTRCSTQMQAEDEVSIQAQIDECRQYCLDKGHEVVEVYKDEGFTGQNANRPAFQKLIADAKRKHFDLVVTWKTNRIARNVGAFYVFKDTLRQYGIELVCIKEPEAAGPVAVILEPLMAGISEFFSLNLAEEVRRGQRQVAKSGYSTGGNPPRGYLPVREVFGLKKSGEPLFHVKWQPDPEWTVKVQEAFNLLIAGCSNEEIIARTGIAKNKSSLCTLFRNPTYIGSRVYNVHRRVKGKVVKYRYDDPEVMVVPESHEAIISREIFNQAQLILNKRRPAPGQIRTIRHDFLLSEVLWCETHNCPITGYGNLTHRYYACEARRRHGEECSLLKKEPLEEFVFNTLKEKVFSIERIREGLKELNQSARGEKKGNDRELSKLRRQAARIEMEIDNLMNAVASGISSEEIAKPVAERRKQIEQIEKDIKAIQSSPANKLAAIPVTNKLIKDLYNKHIEIMESSDPQTKRHYVQSCIDRIKIKEGGLTIYFSVKEPPSSGLLQVAGVHLSNLAILLPDRVLAGRS